MTIQVKYSLPYLLYLSLPSSKLNNVTCILLKILTSIYLSFVYKQYLCQRLL